jgi:dihydrofolate reductase
MTQSTNKGADNPLITLVVAMSANRVIGRNGTLPWRLPADLRQFKADTLGKPVVMGRKTFQSIGRPLPGRHNIVLTRSAAPVTDPALLALSEGTAFTVVGDWPQVLRVAHPASEIMVIGGAEIYVLALPQADRILLTQVEAEIEGDTFFPELSPSEWLKTERAYRPSDADHAYPIRFLSLQRQR